MHVVVKFRGILLVPTHQFNRDRERPRHIRIVIARFFVTIQLIVNRANSKHLRLQCNANSNFLFFCHCRYSHVPLRTVTPTMRQRGDDGGHPTTLRALRHAAACGAGAGGS